MKVLIADDHAVVRAGIKQIILQIDGTKHVSEAKDGLEALDLIRKNKFDIVILDISMPKLSGFDVLKILHDEYPKLPVLILSMYPEEQYAIRILKAGASGYITKESAPEELKNAINRIINGGKYITTNLAEKIAFQIGDDALKPKHTILSDREFQILTLIANGNPPAKIADQLYISPKTVGTYRKRILDKLELNTTSDIIKYAISHNLI